MSNWRLNLKLIFCYNGYCYNLRRRNFYHDSSRNLFFPFIGCQHISNSCLIRLKSWVIEKLILSGCSATSDSSESVELLVKKLANLTELDIGLTTGERTINNAVSELADIDNPILR